MLFNIHILGETLQFVGEVTIAYLVLSVHLHIMKEKSIDLDVVAYMKRERLYAIVGIALVILGYVLKIASESGLVS